MASLQYLDSEGLESLDAAAFRARSPYPWANPAGLVTEAGFRELRKNLPDLSLFTYSRSKGSTDRRATSATS